MRCARCGRCCLDTRMELSERDIRRLEGRGHSRRDFVTREDDGIARLRNVDGHCYFFDPEGLACKEYAARPEGCDLYPVNLDQEDRVLVDEFCQAGGALDEGELRARGAALKRLLRVIEREAIPRPPK